MKESFEINVSFLFKSEDKGKTAGVERNQVGKRPGSWRWAGCVQNTQGSRPMDIFFINGFSCLQSNQRARINSNLKEQLKNKQPKSKNGPCNWGTLIPPSIKHASGKRVSFSSLRHQDPNLKLELTDSSPDQTNHPLILVELTYKSLAKEHLKFGSSNSPHSAFCCIEEGREESVAACPPPPSWRGRGLQPLLCGKEALAFPFGDGSFHAAGKNKELFLR